MDLQNRKISFVQEFLRIQNEDIISGLEKLLREKKAELIKKNQHPMTIKEFNHEIDQALEDSKNDKVAKATDLKDKINKWS